MALPGLLAVPASTGALTDGISQNPPDLFFHAAPVFFGASPQLLFDSAFDVANNKLGHDKLLSFC